MAEAVILLVEGTGEGSLAPALDKAGYDVHVNHTGAEALRWAAQRSPDLLVFDGASLPAAEGPSCGQLRTALGTTPIIHTRRDGDSKDASAQADVYLMKPFTARKVLNRIRALLPASVWEEQVVRAGDLTFFVGKRSVAVAGEDEVQLTPKLACLLEEFLRHPNDVRSRRDLMRNVWQTDYVGDTRTLDVHIRWVREAIEMDPGSPARLLTVRGVGYVLRVPPVQEM